MRFCDGEVKISYAKDILKNAIGNIFFTFCKSTLKLNASFIENNYILVLYNTIIIHTNN